jgi:hypothetical protein
MSGRSITGEFGQFPSAVGQKPTFIGAAWDEVDTFRPAVRRRRSLHRQRFAWYHQQNHHHLATLSLRLFPCSRIDVEKDPSYEPLVKSFSRQDLTVHPSTRWAPVPRCLTDERYHFLAAQAVEKGHI